MTYTLVRALLNNLCLEHSDSCPRTLSVPRSKQFQFKHNLALNGGSFKNWGISLKYSPAQFSWRIFSQVAHLDQSHASKKNIYLVDYNSSYFNTQIMQVTVFKSYVRTSTSENCNAFRHYLITIHRGKNRL